MARSFTLLNWYTQIVKTCALILLTGCHHTGWLINLQDRSTIYIFKFFSSFVYNACTVLSYLEICVTKTINLRHFPLERQDLKINKWIIIRFGARKLSQFRGSHFGAQTLTLGNLICVWTKEVTNENLFGALYHGNCFVLCFYVMLCNIMFLCFVLCYVMLCYNQDRF